jgi:serine/threonine-protein kinase
MPFALPPNFAFEKEMAGAGYAARFIATASDAERRVAVSFPWDQHVDADFGRRMSFHLQADFRLREPHILELYDVGVFADRLYVVQEPFEAPTLRSQIGQNEWSASAVCDLIGQIAEALGATLRAGIIHGAELDPARIFALDFEDGWRVKVDFVRSGLETYPGSESDSTHDFDSRRMQYLAPERLTEAAYTPRVDVYALSMIGFELIAGHLPWPSRGTADLAMAILNRPPPPITHAHPSFSRLDAINELFQRALSKDPDRRPKDAASFAAELLRAL